MVEAEFSTSEVYYYFLITNSKRVEELVVLGFCDASFTALESGIFLLGLLWDQDWCFWIGRTRAVLWKSGCLRCTLGHVCIGGLLIRNVQLLEQFGAIREKEKQKEPQHNVDYNRNHFLV